MSIVVPIGITTIALGFSILATYGISRLAHKFGWVSYSAAHHIHNGYIPRLGGVAIYVAVLSTFILGASSGLMPSWQHSLTFLMPASLIFLVGFIDDCSGLSPRSKLFFQIVCSTWFFFGYWQTNHFFPMSMAWLPSELAGPVSLCATLAWIVFITNSINLIDGLDGLASGISISVLLALFCGAMMAHNSESALLVLIIASAVVGFLFFNFNPASIFLGDSGSLFLGFMLSTLTLDIPHGILPVHAEVLIATMIFGVPITETCLSIARRVLSNKPIFQADKGHMHHHLLRKGYSHRGAVLVLYAASAIFTILSLNLMRNPSWGSCMATSLLVLLLSTLGIHMLGYTELHEIFWCSGAVIRQQHLVANDIVLRKSVQMLRRATNWNEANKAMTLLFQIPEVQFFNLKMEDGYGMHRELLGGKIVDRTSPLKSFRETVWISEGSECRFHIDIPLQNNVYSGILQIGLCQQGKDLSIDLVLFISMLQPVLNSFCQTQRSCSHATYQETLLKPYEFPKEISK